MKSGRWQDWLIVLLGFWLAISPWELGYTLSHSVSGNACGVGVVLIMFNLISVARIVDEGQEIVNILVGTWLILSPYALHFAINEKVAINASVVGVAIIGLAAWQIYDATRKTKQ